MSNIRRNIMVEQYAVVAAGDREGTCLSVLLAVRACAATGPFQTILLGKPSPKEHEWRNLCSSVGGTIIVLPDDAIPHAWRFFPLELQRALLLRHYLIDKAPALVIAPCHDASLFFCIQARESLGEHARCRFLLAMNAPYEYELHRSGAWNLRGVEGTKLMWAERYCAERCDAVVATDDAALAWVNSKGWKLPEGSVMEADGDPAAPQESSSGQKSPLISICVAHYNHGAYLPDALESLAAQTWPNLEILVFDDGSSESLSLDVFARCKARYDDRFRFFEGENRGPSMARNSCAAQARGEFLLFFDADNLATPEMIATLYVALNRSQATITLSHFAAFKHKDRHGPVQEYRWGPLGVDLATALQQNCIGDVSFLIRRKLFLALGGFPATPYGCEDWTFLVRAALAGHKMAVVPESLYWYRHTENGMRSTMPLCRSHEQVLREYATVVPGYVIDAVRHLLLPSVYEPTAGMTPVVTLLYRLGLWLDDAFVSLFPAGSRCRRFLSWARRVWCDSKAEHFSTNNH